MAKVTTKTVIGARSTGGFSAYAAEIPVDIQDEMLNAEADVIQPKIHDNADKLLRGKYFTGTTRDSLSRKKPVNWKNGERQIALVFKGVRVDKNGKRRNAEVAFINEYGSRNKPARPFIQKSIDEGEKEAFDRAEGIFRKWQTDKGM